MDDSTVSAAVDAYIAGFPPETQQVLERLRSAIRAVVPDAVETISYGIPTFDLHGKHLVHFGGFSRHVGFYPTPSGTEAFQAQLAGYKAGKGSVQFRLDEPLPEDLVRQIVEFRVRELQGLS